MNMKCSTWPRWKKWGTIFSIVYFAAYLILWLVIIVMGENSFFIAYIFSFPSAPGNILFAPLSFIINYSLVGNLIVYFAIGASIGKFISKNRPKPESVSGEEVFGNDYTNKEVMK